MAQFVVIQRLSGIILLVKVCFSYLLYRIFRTGDTMKIESYENYTLDVDIAKLCIMLIQNYPITEQYKVHSWSSSSPSCWLVQSSYLVPLMLGRQPWNTAIKSYALSPNKIQSSCFLSSRSTSWRFTAII